MGFIRPATALVAIVLAMALTSCQSAPKSIDHLRELREEASLTTPRQIIRIGKAFEQGSVVPRNRLHAYAWYYVAYKAMNYPVYNHLYQCNESTDPNRRFSYPAYDLCTRNIPWKNTFKQTHYLLDRLRRELPVYAVRAAEAHAIECVYSDFENCPADWFME